MRFSVGSKRTLEASSLDASNVALILTRLEAAVPHLAFNPWTVTVPLAPIDAQGEVLWKAAGAVEVLIYTETGLRLASACRRELGKVSKADYEFLLCLATESLQMVESQLGDALSLLDFGTLSVAQELKRIASLGGDIVGVLRFIRSLAHETYETQRLSYGVIVSNRAQGDEAMAHAFENKRLKRLTDGFSTAILIDEWARIASYRALDTPINESRRFTRRPWWSAGLADASEKIDGIGIALARSGDVIVLHQGQLLFTQRSGRWQIWNHTAIVARLRQAWVGKGRRGHADRVLHYLYHVALDLAFRRSGGLLVLVNSSGALKALLISASDRIGGPMRGAAERALDQIFERTLVQHLDRRIVTDIASLDGALVVDRSGRVLAYGAMTKPAAGAAQGARTRAAIGASRHGTVVKVSSDGHVAFYADGRCFLEL